MAMIDRINSRVITIGIHTFKRVLSVNRILLALCEKCTIDGLRIVIVNDDPSSFGAPTTDPMVHDLAHDRGYTIREVENDSESHGVTAARNVMLHECLSYDPDHIVYIDDDAIPGRQCIERMVALQIQEPRFAISATSGNYTRFWRDFKRNSVKFYTSLGIAYSFLASAVKEVGFQDERIKVRSDHEYSLRMWDRGYWTAAVRAPVSHKRFADRDDGGTVPNNRSKEWADDAELIRSLYPEKVRITKRSFNIIPTFKYPSLVYELDDDLVLKLVPALS
jgi:hypothetical protein